MASYVGISSKTPNKYLGPNVDLISIVTRNRAPTGADIRQGSTGKYYPIGSFWIISKNPTTGIEGAIYWLSKIVANVAFWISVDSGSGDLLGIHTPDGNTATPIANVINFLNGVGMTITSSTNNITFNSTGGGLNWVDVPGTTQAMIVNTGYVADNAGLVTLTLPSTAAFGTLIAVLGRGAGGWTIAQNAGQQMIVGSSSTTVGVGGSVSSTDRRDSIFLLCTSANTEFTRTNIEGNVTIV
jgi:hypothetical protein